MAKRVKTIDMINEHFAKNTNGCFPDYTEEEKEEIRRRILAEAPEFIPNWTGRITYDKRLELRRQTQEFDSVMDKIFNPVLDKVLARGKRPAH